MILIMGWIIATALAGFPAAAPAVEIIIDQGVEKKLPVAVIPFARKEFPLPRSDGIPLPDPARIIIDDLHYSGLYDILPFSDLPGHPNDPADVLYADWRRIGVEHLLIGQLIHKGNDDYQINFYLLDVYKEARLVSESVSFKPSQWRLAAHRISDQIFTLTTGRVGVYTDRIIYTARDSSGTEHTLRIADYDGHNQQTLLVSPQPLLSPTASPEGEKIAYVSFEGRGTSIYVQEVASGNRQRVASWPGINSAPSFAPDGKRLSITLSKDGNPEIYVLHLETAVLLRVTDNPAIDTEPVWSTDSKRLYFTSDRSGYPQIYEARLQDGRIQRLTFNGDYNANATIAPDGYHLGVVHNSGNGFRIGVHDLQTGLFTVIGGRMAEALSFARNSWLLLYSSENGIATLPMNGSPERPLIVPRDLQVREAIWLRSR